MRFRLIIDPQAEEEVVATVRSRSALTDRLEEMVTRETPGQRIVGYGEDAMKLLPLEKIECVTMQAGKVCAIDSAGRAWRLKMRLSDVEALLPEYFIRINKSAIANEKAIQSFAAAFNGAVDAVFRCGHVEYVSRRCFAAIRRRYEG